MVLAPLGAADSPLPTENWAGAVSRAGPWGQLGSATEPCKGGGGKQEPPSAPPLAELVLGMLEFASVYIPAQQNDSL